MSPNLFSLLPKGFESFQPAHVRPVYASTEGFGSLISLPGVNQ